MIIPSVNLTVGVDFEWLHNTDGTLRSLKLTDLALQKLNAAGFGDGARNVEISFDPTDLSRVTVIGVTDLEPGMVRITEKLP